MIISKEHKIFSSFKEWFEHTLLNEGQAFFNKTTPLYSMEDSRQSLNSYSAPFYQWVFDSSVSGAVVPTASGINVPFIDYENGRTLSGAPTGQVSYSVKELNIYTTSESDAKLILETKYNSKPNPRNITGSGLAPYQIVAPCIFLKPERRETELVSFGGNQCKKMNFSAIIISDDEMKRYGVGNLFANKKYSAFPYFDDTPINRYGDLKSGYYNYEERQAAHDTPDRLVHIQNVTYTPIEVDSIASKSPNLLFSKLYFELWHYSN